MNWIQILMAQRVAVQCNAYHISNRDEENRKAKKQMKQMTSRFSHKLTEKSIRCHGCMSAHQFPENNNIDTKTENWNKKKKTNDKDVRFSGTGININMCMLNSEQKKKKKNKLLHHSFRDCSSRKSPRNRRFRWISLCIFLYWKEHYEHSEAYDKFVVYYYAKINGSNVLILI